MHPSASPAAQRRRPSVALCLVILALASIAIAPGCAHSSALRHDAAQPAEAALERGAFDEAEKRASTALDSDPGAPEAALVRAIARYERVMHRLSLDVRTLAAGAIAAGAFNQHYMETTLGDAETQLAAVDRDLAIAAEAPDLYLDLCVACLEIDWNGNGRVDARDRLLFQIEQDADGNPIPENDPRRKPTFRFDHGDVLWARAFVAFQRALLDLAVAYDWSALEQVVFGRDEAGREIRIALRSADRVHAARDRLLEGLAQSRASREAYLAERDDEREWVPNPRQKSHPLPLPVDDALYQTWLDVANDIERLVRGEEGLAVADVARLGGRARHGQDTSGYLDIGSMLSDPRDIVLDVDALEKLEDDHDAPGIVRSVCAGHVRRTMKASPLPARLTRMKGEIDRGAEPLERKLRYLLWIN